MSRVFQSLGGFHRQLPGAGALVGIDHGAKSLGIAVSDHERRISAPVVTIRARKFGERMRQILTVCDGRDAVGIVIGFPRNMDGTEGPRCQSVRAFARNLASRVDLPITFWDERLSTHEAENMMIEAGVNRRRRSESIDRVAASLILQGALDALAEHGAETD